ncbi:MAG: hypothetical protein ACREPU_13875 [Rhodanobacteraceae bacterium]
MFNKDQLIADCQAALHEEQPVSAVREIVAHAISDPAALTKEFGAPNNGDVQAILRSTELTIINALWPVGQIVMPHEHALWAVVGVYSGREDNILWRRIKDDPDGRIKPIGALSLGEGAWQLSGLTQSIRSSIPLRASRLRSMSTAEISSPYRAVNGTPIHCGKSLMAWRNCCGCSRHDLLRGRC